MIAKFLEIEVFIPIIKYRYSNSNHSKGNMMNLSEKIKFNGNVNRILEMSEQGVGNHGISGAFYDFGIKITPEEVNSIKQIVPKLDKKALPKENAIKMIAGVQFLKKKNKNSEISLDNNTSVQMT